MFPKYPCRKLYSPEHSRKRKLRLLFRVGRNTDYRVNCVASMRYNRVRHRLGGWRGYVDKVYQNLILSSLFVLGVISLRRLRRGRGYVPFP